MNPPGPKWVWRVAGASVTGVNHRGSALPCQDDHYWQILDDQVVVAAVADGAGTARHAHLGAGLAARTAVDQVVRNLGPIRPLTDQAWTSLLVGAFEGAREAVLQRAGEIGVPPGELATTLLLAVAGPEDMAAGQIGDGAIVARLDDDSFLTVVSPRPREYLNETTFLTSESFLDEVDYCVLPVAVTGLALLTDGLQMLALNMPQGKPHPAFFSPLLRQLAGAPAGAATQVQLQRFLQSPRVTSRTDDDLTLILAVPGGV